MGKAELETVDSDSVSTRECDPAELVARIGELEGDVLKHKNLYYNQSTPEISDGEFDALEEELRQLRELYPGLANQVIAEADSALHKVGADPLVANQFSSVAHKTAMLSLDKVHSETDLQKWLDKYPDEKLAIWPKFDGVSLSLTYEAGELIRAASRGDGRIGEDITANAIRVDGVRRRLDEKIDCEIRGEVVMLRDEFSRYNQAHPEKPLSNPRNAVSGTLRLKDPADARGRKLQFYAFDLIIDEAAAKQKPLNSRLEELGFPPEGYAEGDSSADVLDFIKKTELNRDGLNYEIDGIVIKIADPDKYRALGTTSKHPRGAMAMKLAAEIGETEIESVEWAVGKTGKVTPRAKIRSLFLSGTNINYATLHNYEDIQRKGIRIGQRVEIKRAGDVIPFIIGPAAGAEANGSAISIPKECPSCGSTLSEKGDSKILQCNNSQSCPAQTSRRLQHWASRGGSDIDGMSEGILTKLEEAGKVNRASDIYKLEAADITGLEGMGERSAEKLIASISASKDVGLRRAIQAWSIPNASEGTAKRLCLHGYTSPEMIARASVEELAKVEDIGTVVAGSLNDFFNNPETVAEVKRLRQAGVNLDVHKQDQPVKLDPANQNPLTGKTVCLTGALSIGRSAFKKELEALGAKVSSSVSAKTDYLISGEGAGSKLDKAKAAGVTVLDEDAARSMM